jgi:hypothetical protein
MRDHVSIEEQRRTMVLARVVAGSLPMTEAATLLGLSERSVWRLKRRFLADGPAGLVHGNRGRPLARRLDDAAVRSAAHAGRLSHANSVRVCLQRICARTDRKGRTPDQGFKRARQDSGVRTPYVFASHRRESRKERQKRLTRHPLRQSDVARQARFKCALVLVAHRQRRGRHVLRLGQVASGVGVNARPLRA